MQLPVTDADNGEAMLCLTPFLKSFLIGLPSYFTNSVEKLLIMYAKIQWTLVLKYFDVLENRGFHHIPEGELFNFGLNLMHLSPTSSDLSTFQIVVLILSLSLEN